MIAESLTWMACRVDASTLEHARAFAAALGLTVLVDEPSKLMAATERGDVIEYCGPEAEVPAHLFAGQSTVIGFRVADVDAATAELTTAGFEPFGDPVDAGPVRFVHLRGPGGVVYGLIQPVSR